MLENKNPFVQGEKEKVKKIIIIGSKELENEKG
jgi:hypothetical protein